MKTTIDLPDDLYRRAKIKAVERSITLKDLLIASLADAIFSAPRSLKTADSSASPAARWSRRRIVPGYVQLREANTFAAGPDSTAILDEERGAR